MILIQSNHSNQYSHYDNNDNVIIFTECVPSQYSQYDNNDNVIMR